MSNSNVLKQRFREDPGEAVAFIRAEVLGRNRQVTVFLRTLLECLDELRSTDPGKAVTLCESVIALLNVRSRWRGSPSERVRGLLGLSHGVYGSSLAVQGNRELAEVALTSGLKLDPPQEIEAALEARRAILAMHNHRFPDALRLADRALLLTKDERWWRSVYTGRDAFYLVRSTIVLNGYQCGVIPFATLSQAERDALSGLDSSFEEVRETARNLLLVVATFRCFAGEFMEFDLPEHPPRTFPRGSVLLAKSYWTWALASIIKRSFTERPERCLREARDIFIARGLSDEVVQVTLDLQWWLIASGAPLRAILENTLIEECLDLVRFERRPLELWMAEVERRRISEDVLRGVFGEVRGLQRVIHPAKFR